MKQSYIPSIAPHRSSRFLHQPHHIPFRETQARWVVVTRGEYVRLRVMQGVLLMLLLALTGVSLV